MPNEGDLSSSAKVARGATYVFIQGFATAALGVIYIILLTRLLSQNEVGTFGVLTFALGLIQTAGLLSLQSASTKYIAQFIAEGNREKAKSVVTQVLRVSMVIGGVAFVIVFVGAFLFSGLLSTSLLVVQTLALASFFVVLYYQAIAFLQGLQMIGKMAAINLLYTVIQYSLALYLIYLGFGVLGITVSWVVALAVSSLLALALTGRSLGIMSKPFDLKPLLYFSFPIYISGIFGFLVLWVSQLFILPYLGLATFGMYNIANRAAVVPGLVSGALLAALYPKLSQLYAESGKNSLENAFTVSTRYVILVGFPLTLLVAILAYPIMILFAGAAYAPAAFPLALLCIASLFGTIGVAISPTFFTMERTWMASLPSFASVLVEVLFSFILIAFLGMGMIGAATSMVIAAAAGFILSVVLLRRFITVKFDTEMLWRVSLACVIMILAVLGFDVIRQLLNGPPYSILVFRLLLLPVYVVVGVVAYFFAIIALRAIRKEDIELFREYLPANLRWVAALIELFVPNKTAKGEPVEKT